MPDEPDAPAPPDSEIPEEDLITDDDDSEDYSTYIGEPVEPESEA